MSRANCSVPIPFDQPSDNSPSILARSISAPRVWKPRFIALWIRLWASGLRTLAPKRSESRRKSSAGASPIAFNLSLTTLRQSLAAEPRPTIGALFDHLVGGEGDDGGKREAERPFLEGRGIARSKKPNLRSPPHSMNQP